MNAFSAFLFLFLFMFRFDMIQLLLYKQIKQETKAFSNIFKGKCYDLRFCQLLLPPKGKISYAYAFI